MERRVTSHTEEEEMNQRRRLLTQARKGDEKSIELLFELYQVKVFSGDALKKKKLPSFPVAKPTNGSTKGGSKSSKAKDKASKSALQDTKAKKEEKGIDQSSTKGTLKLKTKTETAKIPSSKATKAAKPPLKKESRSKQASASNKKISVKPPKPKKITSVSKSHIAKKK